MDVPDRTACRCAVVSFDYIPVVPVDLDPLFIASYPVVSTPCSEEAHTCVHLLYHRYHPFDLAIHRWIVLANWSVFTISLTFIVDSFDSFDLLKSRLMLIFILVYEQSFAGRFWRCNFCSRRFIFIFLFFLFHGFSLSFFTFFLFAFCHSRSSNVRRRSLSVRSFFQVLFPFLILSCLLF